jgi:hypothetical protein
VTVKKYGIKNNVTLFFPLPWRERVRVRGK